MIRIYFDWNIIVGLKNDLPKGLLDILVQNRFRFHILFSTAHIGDIYKGYEKDAGITPEITSDLDFLDQVTGKTFFYYDKPNVRIDNRSANDLFNDRITTEQWWSEFVEKNLAGSLLLTDKASSTQPPPTATDVFKSFKTDPESATVYLLQEIRHSDLYKELRKLYQTAMGINRDQIYAHTDPLDKIEEQIAQSGSYEKTLEEYEERLRDIHGNDRTNWFNNILIRYLILDIAGFQEDKIKQAANKTFQNTIEDGFHVAFASQCDFYVTNDERNRRKTSIVYNSLKINTIIYSSGEFIEFLKEYIPQEQKHSFLEDVIQKINDWKQAGHETDNPKRIHVRLKDFVLDYFNKAYYYTDIPTKDGRESWMIVLTKEKPTNGRYTIIADINTLLAKLAMVFGPPITAMILLDEGEFASIKDGQDWPGRRWQSGDLVVKFRSLNGYFQLYLYPIEAES